MEPMVILALGIVIYCLYLTAGDLLVDLRREGILRKQMSGRTLANRWAAEVKRFFNTEEQPQRAWRTGTSAVLVPCRQQLSFSGQRPAASRLYRMRQG